MARALQTKSSSRFAIILTLLVLVLAGIGLASYFLNNSSAGEFKPAYKSLPAEAKQTIRLIDRGGPFPYRRDASAFSNREQRLPKRPRGYYREYTVKTPGLRHRGPRRIVAGQKGELYYTADHYRSFKRVR